MSSVQIDAIIGSVRVSHNKIHRGWNN